MVANGGPDRYPSAAEKSPFPTLSHQGGGALDQRKVCMARPYEVVYIFDPALDEETINSKLTAFHALIEAKGVEAPQVNHWGRRTLPYPIKRRDTGYYVVASFATESILLPEYERALKLDEGVLRHLVVLNNEPPTPANYTAAKPQGSEEEEEE